MTPSSDRLREAEAVCVEFAEKVRDIMADGALGPPWQWTDERGAAVRWWFGKEARAFLSSPGAAYAPRVGDVVRLKSLDPDGARWIVVGSPGCFGVARLNPGNPLKVGKPMVSVEWQHLERDRDSTPSERAAAGLPAVEGHAPNCCRRAHAGGEPCADHDTRDDDCEIEPGLAASPAPAMADALPTPRDLGGLREAFVDAMAEALIHGGWQLKLREKEAASALLAAKKEV